MARRNKKSAPAPRLVEKVELPKGHVRLRLILAVAFLVIGGIALGWGLTAALNEDPGWKTIEVDAQGLHCGEDFEFVYDLGRTGVSATAELKALTIAYSEACKTAYEIFDTTRYSEDIGNLARLNAHPNEAVVVDPGLYAALKRIVEYQDRHIYLGPIYEVTSNLYGSENDAFAADADPKKNPELAELVEKLAGYARSSKHVDIQLLGNNQIRLCVSSEYLAFLKQEQIATIMDLGWMKNAFIVDYLADMLTERGYIYGHITSYDGFTRNLDNRGVEYAYNLFDLYNNGLYLPANMCYSKPTAIVYFRSYPMEDRDMDRYYRYGNGDVAGPYVDLQDGKSKFAADNLVCYSQSAKSCSGMLMQIVSLYTADSLDTSAVNKLTTDYNIYSVWFDGTTLCYNQKDLKLQMKETEGVTFKAAYAGK